MPRPTGYHAGDWLASCHQCGQTRLASTMRRHWQGYWVCSEHWEERHPQDFIRATQDVQTVPWAQPPGQDIDIAICTINGRSGIPAHALPGCMMPGNTLIDQTQESPTVPPLCDIYEIQGVPGWAGPGCAISGFDPMAA
jgi:hypothetical protein